MKILLMLAVSALLWGQGHGEMCDPNQGSSCESGNQGQSGRCLDIGVCECQPMMVPNRTFHCYYSNRPSLTVVKPVMWSGEALVGGTLVLQCNAVYQQVEYRWYKNGSRISNANDSQLEFQQLNKDDGGVYECLTVLFGKWSRRSDEMFLEVFTSISSLANMPKVVGMPNKVATGSKVHLRCLHAPVTDATTYKWLVDDKDLSDSAKAENDLWITMDDSWLGKKVQCEADVVQNSLARRFFSDAVRTPDRFQDTFQFVSVSGNLLYKQEEPIYLTCNTPLDYAPSPLAYVWFFEGTKVIPHSNDRILKIGGSNLTGEYHCVAASDAAGVQRQSKPVMVVHGTPKPSIKVSSPLYWNGEAAKGGRMTFKCEMPNHEHVEYYQWLKDGKPVDKTTSDTLQISTMNFAYYQCSVKYSISEAIHVPVTMTTTQNPKVMGMPIYASENSLLFLICGNVPAVSNQRYTWTLDGKEVAVVYGQNFTIETISSTFNKTVTCGQDNLISLPVSTPPTVTSDIFIDPAVTGRFHYREGETIELKCTLNKNVAQPKDVQFQWTGPNGLIINHRMTLPTLTIPSSRARFSGTYGCAATFKNGPTLSSSPELVTVGMPNPPSITLKQKYWNGDLITSTWIEMFCTPNVPENGKYRWYRSGELIPNMNAHNYATNVAGDYQCSIDYFGRWTNLSNPLTVRDAKPGKNLPQPVFVIGMRQYMNLGDDLGLACVNLPDGKKTLKWYMGDKEVTEFRGLEEIHKPFTNDMAGQKIKCAVEIEYDQGIDRALSTPVQFPFAFAYTTTYKPMRWNTTDPSSSIIVPRIVINGPKGPYEQGSSVNISCETPSHRDTAYYEWKKFDKSVGYSRSNNYTLELVFASDAGSYSCALVLNGREVKSWNTVDIYIKGYTTKSWQATTYKPMRWSTTDPSSSIIVPRIVINGPKGPYEQGSSVNISCETPSHRDTAYYEWKKFDKSVGYSRSNNYTLELVFASDAGSYSCALVLNGREVKSWNTVDIYIKGYTTKSWQAKTTVDYIISPPRIFIQGYQGPFYEGAGIVLHCETSSNINNTRSLYTQWNWNQRYLTTTYGSTYTMYSVNLENTGFYTCGIVHKDKTIDSYNSVHVTVRRQPDDGDYPSSAVSVVSFPCLIVLLAALIQVFK